jgi:hypothetical protein
MRTLGAAADSAAAAGSEAASIVYIAEISTGVSVQGAISIVAPAEYTATALFDETSDEMSCAGMSDGI